MKSHKRTLIPSKVQFGTTTAGCCSMCHKPLEVTVGAAEALSAANERLRAIFDAHVCDEDFSQAAARIVQETTER